LIVRAAPAINKPVAEIYRDVINKFGELKCFQLFEPAVFWN